MVLIQINNPSSCGIASLVSASMYFTIEVRMERAHPVIFQKTNIQKSFMYSNRELNVNQFLHFDSEQNADQSSACTVSPYNQRC